MSKCLDTFHMSYQCSGCVLWLEMFFTNLFVVTLSSAFFFFSPQHHSITEVMVSKWLIFTFYSHKNIFPLKVTYEKTLLCFDGWSPSHNLKWHIMRHSFPRTGKLGNESLKKSNNSLNWLCYLLDIHSALQFLWPKSIPLNMLLCQERIYWISCPLVPAFQRN